jgi:methyltransferase (TIGR00027 family)
MDAMSTPSHGDITHVSDTALLVAACRAIETEAEDAFIRDPFAARLAGDRGMAILRAYPGGDMMRFGIATRSRFIDELLLELLATKPISTVVSVGCGLDARPWRLDLPADLRWLEVDFPDMLEYKESVLSGETPRCRRERLTADVNDPAQRQALYAAAGREPALMITEGLLMYLPAATVDALAAESWRESGIAHWMSDITSTTFAKAITLDLSKGVRSVQASDSLPGEEILATIHRNGWTGEARRSYLTDMAFALPRIKRMFGDRPPSTPPPADDPSGVQLLMRC